MKNIFLICAVVSGSCFAAEDGQLNSIQQAFVDQTSSDLKKVDPKDPAAIAAALGQGVKDLTTLGATPEQIAYLQSAKAAFEQAAQALGETTPGK